MRNQLLVSVCALGLALGANDAFAGAYGEPIEPEETPMAPPPPAPVPEPEPELDCAATGPYIGIGSLYAIEMFDDGVANGGARTGNSYGFQTRLGYRLSRHWGAELNYQWFNDFDIDPGHIDGWAASINLKGYLPMGRLQPYGLAGLGYISTNGSGGNHPAAANPGDDFMIRVGGGAEMCINEHFSMGPEVVFTKGTGAAESIDLLTVSLGLNYKF